MARKPLGMTASLCHRRRTFENEKKVNVIIRALLALRVKDIIAIRE